MRNILFFYFVLISSHLFAQISNPRAWAEFEETQGVIINPINYWHLPSGTTASAFTDFIREQDSLYVILINEVLSQDIDVYYLFDTLNVSFEHDTAMIDTLHNGYNIDTDHPNFHKVKYNGNLATPDPWVRDHGPMNVYKNGVDSLYTVLFGDDITGKIVSNYLNIPKVEFSDGQEFVSDGGNYMVDGKNMAIIDGGGSVLPDYASVFGLDYIHEVPTYLKHIDYFMKLVNEETLLISWQEPDNYTTGYESYTYQQDIDFLNNAIVHIQNNAISQTGRPLKIIKITNAPSYDNPGLNLTYLTNEASYVNSLIVNDAVFVPQYKNPATDTVALNIYKETMPGYKIIPVPCRGGARAQGAIHCLTNAIASREPILIQHSWFPDSVNQITDYEVSANISTRSGINTATLYWKTDLNAAFQTVLMNNTSGDVFTASIPGQAHGTRVHYYIKAEANSGKIGNKPLVAPDWAYNFLVHEDGINIGISESANEKYSIEVYPNPARDNINFNLSNFSQGRCEIIIYDLWGKMITKKVCQSFTTNVNVMNYSAGHYLYVIKNLDTKERLHGKLVKQ